MTTWANFIATFLTEADITPCLVSPAWDTVLSLSFSATLEKERGKNVQKLWASQFKVELDGSLWCSSHSGGKTCEHDGLLFIANKTEAAAREEGASSVTSSQGDSSTWWGERGERRRECYLSASSLLPPAERYFYDLPLPTLTPPAVKRSSESSPDAHIRGVERLDNGRIFPSSS